MKFPTLNHALGAALITGFAALPLAAVAAAHTAGADKMDKSHKVDSTDKRMSDKSMWSDRALSKAWGSEKEQLENALRAVTDRAGYAKAIAAAGYTVTSINSDRPDYLEYEVVKGRNSYEIQIDFDKDAPKAKKVDVTTNMWRTDATKAAMRGEKVAAATKALPVNAGYSDRERMKGWTGEKEQLEKALAAGQNRASYEATLKKLGYQITSVNDADKDHLEYEVVKGGHSYEVQIDLDNKVGKKVDVTTNMWESEATEKALAGHKGKK